MLADEGAELADHLRMSTSRDVGVDSLLEDAETFLLEARRLSRQARHVSQVGERGASPERKRLMERSFARELLEADGVDRCGGRCQRVASASALDRVLAESLPQARDVGLHDLRRACRRIVGPQRVDDRLERCRATACREQGEQRPLLRRTEIDAVAVAHRLNRTEDRNDDRHDVVDRS